MPSQIFSELALTRSPESSTPPDMEYPEFDHDALTFGYPLCRMVPIEPLHDGLKALELSHQDWVGYDSDSDSDSTTSSLALDHDFETLVDDALRDSQHPLDVTRGDMALKTFTLSTPSEELYMLLELNHPRYRDDPWNPVPHIIRAVERPRDDLVCLCFAPLVEYNQPPLRTVANFIDLFRQVLEGMTFLHEHNIVSLSLGDPSSLMVDLGPLSSPLDIDKFDRTVYPVKYYFTHLSDAYKYDKEEFGRPSKRGHNPFVQDVKDCARLIDGLLGHVPRIAPKLKSLVKAMQSGEFGAENARKLFEALCKSLEPSIFEIAV